MTNDTKRRLQEAWPLTAPQSRPSTASPNMHKTQIQPKAGAAPSFDWCETAPARRLLQAGSSTREASVPDTQTDTAMEICRSRFVWKANHRGEALLPARSIPSRLDGGQGPVALFCCSRF